MDTTLYMFLHRSQKTEQCSEAIAAPTVLTSAILIIIGIILAWFKFKGKRRNNNKGNTKISPVSTSKSDKLPEGSPAEDFELPFTKFEDIEAATHNSS